MKRRIRTAIVAGLFALALAAGTGALDGIISHTHAAYACTRC
jgi:hypothetical protein